MSSGRFVPAERTSQDFDLNLAPVIDCFTVLIAFVMISTAFASIGVLDAGIVAGGNSPADAKEPDVRLRVELLEDGGVEMKLSGKETQSKALQSRDQKLISQNLGAFKAKWPDLNQVTLAAENGVPYQEVVASLELIRKTVPNVALGGF